MKLILILCLIPLVTCGQPAGDIQLPPPVTTGGKPVMEALMDRHSSREFSHEKLDLQTLSDLLWAADGYNRPAEKKRTAPNSRNQQEIDIYLAMEYGLFLWNVEKNVLQQVSDKDIRATTGKQEFVKDAPLNLIYVANYAKAEGGKTERQIRTSYANTGLIAENAYLCCTSLGLNVIIRAYFDEEDLAKAMNLNKDQQIILCQTIGKPPRK